MKKIVFLAAIAASMVFGLSDARADEPHKQCYTKEYVESLKKRLEVARDAQTELNKLLTMANVSDASGLRKKINDQEKKISDLTNELADVKKKLKTCRDANSDVAPPPPAPSPPPAPPPPPPPARTGPSKADLQSLKDDLEQLKKAVKENGDADGTLQTRVLGLETKLDDLTKGVAITDTAVWSAITEATNDMNALRDDIRNVNVASSPVDVYVGLRAEVLMRNEIPAWDGGGEICLAGNFTDKWGFLGCGSGGFFYSATTGTGWQASASASAIVALDEQRDHHLAFGAAFKQFGRVSANQYGADGNGLGFMVAPEVRWMYNIVGPLVMSMIAGVGFGPAGQWTPGAVLKPHNEFAIQPYLAVEFSLATGQ